MNSCEDDFPLQFSTTNLLRADASSLTTDQWTLVNNLVGCCDLSRASQIMDELVEHGTEIDLPIVSTADESLLHELLTGFYQEGGKLYRINQDFQHLSPTDRSVLLAPALNNNICLCRTFSFSQKKQFWNQQRLVKYFDDLYGPLAMKYYCWSTEFVEIDEVLFKLALPLFSLSTVSRSFQPNLTDEYADVKTILDLENRYAELLWKYLLYRYTLNEAVRRYLSIIRWFLTMSVVMYHVSLAQRHVQDLESIIEDTELQLIIDEAHGILQDAQ